MSRLALVSKVLCDRELFELRRVIERQRIEIEELKMEMFWREHDISKMRRIIMLVSIHYRTRSDVVHSDESSWQQFIEPILRDFGLEVEITDDPVVRGFLEVPFASGYLQPHSDLDVHLTCTRNFTIASYGAKLCKAKSLDDPELQKLKALFDDVKEAVNNRGALSRVFNRPQADVVRA
jgi:hypothetical protein